MLGRVYLDTGQYKESVIYFEKTLTSDIRTYGEDHPKVATWKAPEKPWRIRPNRHTLIQFIF